MVANVLRVITVLGIFGYLPLLLLRVRRTETDSNVIHLFGTFTVLMGIVAGSWQSYGKTFHYGQPFVLGGVILYLISGIYAEYIRRKKTGGI